jgi:transcriptional regulator with XRE-family HTH domain
MTYPVLDPIATGKRIKELRKQNNLKVREVSEYMGFESEQAVFKWQRGDSMPTLDNMLALSRLFNTPIDDILCERDDAEER